MVIIHEANPTDPLSDQPIRCQIEVHPSGMITVLRSPGCTHNDLMDLCQAVSDGAVPVHDLTPGTTDDIGRISEDDP